MPSFHDHFSSLAAQYAAFRPGYPAALFAHLATLAPRRALAWDCACGTGQASVGLAEHFAQVIATDASARQIAAATSHPRIRYRVAPAEASGLADASVDLVSVAQALHWLTLAPFYAEVERVLVPQGVLAVWTYTLLRVSPPIDAIIGHFDERVIGPYWPPERRHVDAAYRTLDFPFAELPAPALEIEQHWDLGHLLGYVGSWSATARYRERRGEDPVSTLAAALSPLWGDPHERRRIVWPLVLRMGRRP